MAPDNADDYQATAPFEGPEKLLEIWFASSPLTLPDLSSSESGKIGLRKVDRKTWEDMLDVVKCKVLSVVEGSEIDAYLLSESSLFISPHRLILKTCGSTLNLLGLPRILEIASTQANLPTVYRCFYSRKSFMFPERQLGPHRDWKHEVEYLDSVFKNGAAYTIGKVNGDHWLLYMTEPEENPSRTPANDTCDPESSTTVDQRPDFTIEILMSDLSPAARLPFFASQSRSGSEGVSPALQGQFVSEKVGISNIIPPHLTTLDAYAFFPCGYSSNALIKWGDKIVSSNGRFLPPCTGEGYYTIHVTPEEGWSYASFECNIPLLLSDPTRPYSDELPDLETMIQRVVDIFTPGRLTMTLFISSDRNETDEGVTAVEAAQRAFKLALGEATHFEGGKPRRYKRTDKINYEFRGYDLAFASFELSSESSL